MPFLRLTLDRAPSTDDRRRLADALTELTAAVLGKDYSLTALAIEVIPSAHWTIAAETLVERKQASAHLDVKVTAGTNTAAEKADFIERAYRALETVLGPLARLVFFHERGLCSPAAWRDLFRGGPLRSAAAGPAVETAAGPAVETAARPAARTAAGTAAAK